MATQGDWLPGVHAAPNIQGDPALYELENRSLDPDGLLAEAIQRVAPWEDRVVLDLGAGTGFCLEGFHDRARHVIAMEPHGPSRVLACERVARLGLEQASVMAGSAERILLPTDSVDVVHARFAYFWGPGCEAGLAEVDRVLKPGGVVVIVDNDLREGTFAQWLRRLPAGMQRDADENDRFWKAQGFSCETVRSEWRFETREQLEAVVNLEFAESAAGILAGHAGVAVDYVYRVLWRRSGGGQGR